MINYSAFEKVDIRLGTIVEAYEYDQLKKPSIILKINFGINFSGCCLGP